ncbi:MAG: DUF6503 family protein [Anditalea sp.]
MMNRIHLLFFFGIGIIALGCKTASEEQKIIDQAIEAHGGDAYEMAKISFDFRQMHYKILKTPFRFEFSREFEDSLGLVADVLNNEGFSRSIDGKEIAVTDERKKAYSNSVNAVAYFAYLPYGLNDAAVQKHWVRESEVEGNYYDVIKVTFSKEGGGEDFDDEFLYWINKDNGRMDYLAYSYHTDGGGVRFRKAINSRMVHGIRIQDYENYKPVDENTPLDEMEELYKNGELELLSEIEMKNIQVKFLE